MSDETVFVTEIYHAWVVRLILHNSVCSKKVPGKYLALSLVLGPHKDADRTQHTERSALPPERPITDSCLENNDCSKNHTRDIEISIFGRKNTQFIASKMVIRTC
jgi:hypothetical protein